MSFICEFRFSVCNESLYHLYSSLGFYCQVEEQLDPTLKGKPIAVVQYNAWRGGG